MSATTFDTLATAKLLKEAGLPEQQAEAVTTAIRAARDADMSQLATKADLRELELRLEGKLATGLAESGFVPFVYSMATFVVLRAYEFIRNGPVAHGLRYESSALAAGSSTGRLALPISAWTTSASCACSRD